MAPIKPSDYDYSFSYQTLSQMRKDMNLTQSELAELLDVPINTLSRWETGKTTPDAHTLAAIYSIAIEIGIKPKFFTRRPNPVAARKKRTQLAIFWDFQNLSFSADEVMEETKWLIKYLDILFPFTRENRFVQVYTTPQQRQAAEVIRKMNIEVKESYYDADSQLVVDAENLFVEPVNQYTYQARRIHNYSPEATAFILVSNDGDYAQLIRKLSSYGVEVFLWATHEASLKLSESVDRDHFIVWDAPYIIAKCFEVIDDIDGDIITASEFGNLCKESLEDDEYGIYPVDAGFSRNRPYASVLRWLESHGMVKVRRMGGKSNKIRLTPIYLN